MEFTRELALILNCCRPMQCGSDIAALRILVEQGVDWTAFARKAVGHKITPIAAHNLIAHAPDLIPSEIIDAFRAVIEQTRILNRERLREFLDIRDALGAKGIAAIMVGGIALAAEICGDLGLSAVEEQEIAVASSDLSRAVSILRELGYSAQSSAHRLINSGKDASFSLHSADIQMAARTRRRHIEREPVDICSWEDTFRFLAIDGAAIAWRRIKPLCDAAWLVAHDSEIDWRLVATDAANDEDALFVTIALLRAHFGVEIPVDVGSPRTTVDIATKWDATDEPTISEADSVQAHQFLLASATARAAVERDPRNATAWGSLGDALAGLKQHREAVECYDRVLALSPGNIHFLRKRATLLKNMGRKPAAEDQEPRSDDGGDWAHYAVQLFSAKRYAKAAAAANHALKLDASNVTAARIAIQSRIHACDWSKRRSDIERVSTGVAAGEVIITPYVHRAICDSEAEFLALARILANGQGYPRQMLPARRAARAPGRIRLGYLSTESHDATSQMIVGVLEHHNRSRFEVTGVSIGPDDTTEIRRRIRGATERFINVHGIPDDGAAAQLRALDLDIIVDLKGNAGDRRTGILARRAAPVQVSYLGYPGTMGVPFIDYIIADQIIIPPQNRIHYDENVVWLPNSYMATDNRREISAFSPSRAEAGLPPLGFVFASFNYSYKSSPEMFSIWLRLLRSVKHSILWLRDANDDAAANLRHLAESHGVAGDRIIFAPFVPDAADYFARLRLADLFLDTLPFNAHATGVDALWAGLPVVTCMGNTFAGRVGASLLKAAGLPELITSSLEEYAALARDLAENPAHLTGVRQKLVRSRVSCALFDTARLTRDLETAYTEMFERYQAGLPPQSFAVGSRR